MAQKNRKVVKDVPGTVKEFSSITFKKFKKENKDYCTKKELKMYYYSSLLSDLDDVITFILSKGYIQNNEYITELRNGCFEKFRDPKFIKTIEKAIKNKDGEYDEFDMNNIKLLPAVLYEVISDINIRNHNRDENSIVPEDDEEIDVSELYELSKLVLKKKIKKLVSTGIDEDIAFDLLSVIPHPGIMQYSPIYRVKNIFNIMYIHAKDKTLDFKKIIETILKPNGYQYVIIFAIQERKDKYNNFNDKQKAFFNDITAWVFDCLNTFEKEDIEKILTAYIAQRKRDASQGRDGNRRYFIKSLPETNYKNIVEVVNDLLTENPDAETYL